MSSKNNKRIAWMRHNSPTLESYIEKRLNKINNNETKPKQDEKRTNTHTFSLIYYVRL